MSKLITKAPKLRWKRTDNVQIETTETGIITTVEEVARKGGQKYQRWVQVGYTSVIVRSDGKKYIDGLYGQKLVDAINRTL